MLIPLTPVPKHDPLYPVYRDAMRYRSLRYVMLTVPVRHLPDDLRAYFDAEGYRPQEYIERDEALDRAVDDVLMPPGW